MNNRTTKIAIREEDKRYLNLVINRKINTRIVSINGVLYKIIHVYKEIFSVKIKKANSVDIIKPR